MAVGEDTSPHFAQVVALGFVLCLGGCLVSALMPPVGCALMAAGAWLLVSRVQLGRILAALACLVPLVGMCIFSWSELGSYALPATVCALVLSFWLAGRISVTVGVLLVLGTSALTVGCEQAVLVAAGSSVAGYVDSVLDALSARAQTLGETGGAANFSALMAYEQTIQTMKVLWPLMYVAQGALVALLGMAGLALARRLPVFGIQTSFLRFSIPVWGIVVLIATLCTLAASRLDTPVAAGLYSAGMCALVFMRVLYFLQGLAVGTCLMRARRMGALGRVFVLVAMFLLESALYAVSVFGALDTFARFRRGLDLGDQEEDVSQPQAPEPPAQEKR